MQHPFSVEENQEWNSDADIDAVSDSLVGLSLGPAAPVDSGYSVYWAPNKNQWRNINGEWVPFFRWAADVDTKGSGVTGFLQKLSNLGKDTEDALVKRVRQHRDKIAKIKREEKENEAKMVSRYDSKDEKNKLALALRYVEALADTDRLEEVKDFTMDMLKIQGRMLVNDMERESKTFALGFPLRNIDVNF